MEESFSEVEQEGVLGQWQPEQAVVCTINLRSVVQIAGFSSRASTQGSLGCYS